MRSHTEILLVLLRDPSAKKRFRKFLLGKGYLTTRDTFLFVTFLCQTDFDSRKLLKALRRNKLMRPIIDVYLRRESRSSSPGYFGIPFDKVLRLADRPRVIDQIKLRVSAERRGDYSVALNHLLNELHAICHEFDSRKINEKVVV